MLAAELSPSTHDGKEFILDRQGARPAPTGDLNLFRFNASEVAAFSTPDWVKEAVIYQIFPERFANGDTSNDPDFSEWYYEGVTQLPSSGKTNGEYFHLIGDWYDVAGLTRSPYKTDGKPDWSSFYGGDIAGIRENLDYLEDLGITCIYFNPIFEAKSNHKYDAATYMEVDPHFGTNGEFAEFVADCHSRGIRVIIDLAFNHTGHTFFAFVDIREKGEESEYWDWYEFKRWPVPGGPEHTPPNAGDYYDCWWGFGQMPNLNFDLSRPNAEDQKVMDVSQAQVNWPVVNHLLETTRYWFEEMDVDGYRLDVAGDVPFWFRDPVLAFFAKGEMTAEEFDRAIAPGRMIYAQEGVQAQMNLLDSHDTERFLTTAGGDICRLKLAMLFAMTYVGAPTIYYGDEIGMDGRHDPDCRRPFLWDYVDDEEMVELHDYVRKLTALRKEHPCLIHGSFETLIADGGTYAFKRSLGDGEAVVVINTSASETSVEFPVPKGMASVVSAITTRIPELIATQDDSRTAVVLQPLEGDVILVNTTGE